MDQPPRPKAPFPDGPSLLRRIFAALFGVAAVGMSVLTIMVVVNLFTTDCDGPVCAIGPLFALGAGGISIVLFAITWLLWPRWP